MHNIEHLTAQGVRQIGLDYAVGNLAVNFDAFQRQLVELRRINAEQVLELLIRLLCELDASMLMSNWRINSK